MIEHCISAFLEKQERDRRHEFMAEALRLLTENISMITNGRYITKGYREIVKREKIPEKEEYTAGEATQKIKDKFK